MPLNFFQVIVLLTIFVYSLPTSGQSETLDTEDRVANEFIKNSLAKQPNEPPKVDDQYYDMLKVLNDDRAKLDANQARIVEKNPASTNIPEIKSIESTPLEQRTELYARLAEQTGLTVEQIKDLFENPGSHNQQLLKPKLEDKNQ